jgi:ornithine decarboxylase
MGYDFDLLDIGGGFPGADNACPSFQDMAADIRGSLDLHFPHGCGVRIIGEPGRFLVAAAFTLVTCVIGRRQVAKEDGTDLRYMYYVNDGVYGSFNCILYDHSIVKAKLKDVSAEHIS